MDKLLINDLIEKYKLSKEEHNEVLERLKRDLFDGKTIDENPSAMFVIGQPGCGKTTFIKSGNFSKYININSDEYRHLSKYSSEILDKYPTEYAKFTNYDAHLWGDELFAYAIQNGYSVLREKAPIDFSLLDLIKTIPDNYDIVINVVVTGNLTSLLATRERYEKELLQNKNAKLSSIDAHNKCYDFLPAFIIGCSSPDVKINYFVPVGDQFRVYPVEDNYCYNLIETLKDESNSNACFNFTKRMDNIKKSMIRRNAPQEQFDELRKIEDIYLELSNSNNDNIAKIVKKMMSNGEQKQKK